MKLVEKMLRNELESSVEWEGNRLPDTYSKTKKINTYQDKHRKF